MTNRVILCPGQGAQAVGMGRAWFERSPEARAVFEQADTILGNRLGDKLSELCFAGPAQRLNATDVSQPAIYVTSVACWRGMLAAWQAGAGAAALEAGVRATAGLSLGEYTALHLADAISFEEGLELVTLRGRAMQDAAEAALGGMVALIGADEAAADAICVQALADHPGDVLVGANYNAPGQIVISGTKAACDRAVTLAGATGLRATALAVAGAFHSPLMAPAAARLREALARVNIRPPRCAVACNVSGQGHALASSPAQDVAASIRQALVNQLTSPVRWAANCEWLGRYHPGAAHPGDAAHEYHELAPGKTLAGLMRRIDKSLKVETHDEPSAA